MDIQFLMTFGLIAIDKNLFSCENDGFPFLTYKKKIKVYHALDTIKIILKKKKCEKIFSEFISLINIRLTKSSRDLSKSSW